MKRPRLLVQIGFLLAASQCVSVGSAQVQASTARADVAADADRPSSVSPTNVDLHVLKGQLEAFQQELNRTVQQNFDLPFSLLQDAKGIYLPGFGVAFHLEINLHPLRLIMPFDMRPYTPEEIQKAKDAKLQRIRELKACLSQLLLERGQTLNAFAPDQNIAIVVHLFNLPSEGRDLPTQLVLQVNRRMLLDYQGQRLTAEQFQKASSFLEF